MRILKSWLNLLILFLGGFTIMVCLLLVVAWDLSILEPERFFSDGMKMFLRTGFAVTFIISFIVKTVKVKIKF